MIKNNNKQFNNYLGVIHIHSKFSDGTGDIDTITRAAKNAGLDWIVVTDHNSLEIEEGFINGICVIKAEEISPKNDSNHYLAFGINKLIDANQPAEDFINEVKEQNGFGFAAHPDESDFRYNNNLPIKWLDKNIIPDGIEIWNWFSTWADNYDSRNIFTQGFAYLFRDNLITKPKSKTLDWWDKLNNKFEKIIPAIGGVDAHALKFKDYIIPVTIFPYEDMFKTITNVITLNEKLSQNFATAKEQILSAIKEGRNLIINRKLCKTIPQVSIYNSNETAFPGEKIKYDNNTFIKINLGKKFEIRLLCNGEIIREKFAKEAEIPLFKCGKYRVEMSLNSLGYAYSNPIEVM